MGVLSSPWSQIWRIARRRRACVVVMVAEIVAVRHKILVHVVRGHIPIHIGRDHVGGQRMLVIVITRRWGPHCYGVVVR